MRSASRNGSELRLVLLGRGTAEAQREFDRAFRDIPVQISNLGLRSADEASRNSCRFRRDPLCVRGRLFPSTPAARSRELRADCRSSVMPGKQAYPLSKRAWSWFHMENAKL